MTQQSRVPAKLFLREASNSSYYAASNDFDVDALKTKGFKIGAFSPLSPWFEKESLIGR